MVDSNDPPLAVDIQMNLPENSPADFIVGQIVVSDPEDDALTYSMRLGDSNRFSIATDGTVSIGQNAPAMDFEGAESSFVILYRASDAADLDVFDEGLLTIVLSDVNEAPMLVSDPVYLVDESVYDSGIELGRDVTVADPDRGDSATFTASGTSSLGLFTVEASGRVSATSSAAAEDFESIRAFEQDGRRIKAKDTLTITATDQGGL